MLKQEIVKSTHDIAFAKFFRTTNVRLVWFYLFGAANSAIFLLLVIHLHFKCLLFLDHFYKTETT